MQYLEKHIGNKFYTQDEYSKALKKSEIKRINDRLRQMRLQFGTDSTFYKAYRNAITLAIPSEAITASGTISTSNKSIDLISITDLNNLLQHHTAGQIKKEAAEAAERESKITGRNITMKQYLAAQEYVEKIIQEDGDRAYEALTIYWSAAGGRGSGAPKVPYTEWKAIIEGLYRRDEALEANLPETARNIENKLFKRIEVYTDRAKNLALEELF